MSKPKPLENRVPKEPTNIAELYNVYLNLGVSATLVFKTAEDYRNETGSRLFSEDMIKYFKKRLGK